VSFASVLTSMREIRNLTQAELARVSGIQPSILCEYEAGRRDPSIPNVRKLCEALNVGPGTLLEFSSAHPEACPHCYGKGYLMKKQPNRVTLRDKP